MFSFLSHHSKFPWGRVLQRGRERERYDDAIGNKTFLSFWNAACQPLEERDRGVTMKYVSTSRLPESWHRDGVRDDISSQGCTAK